MTYRERTPMSTVQVWEACQAATGLGKECRPGAITGMARVLEALAPHMTYRPEQISLAFRQAAVPALQRQYPGLATAQTAAEAVDAVQDRTVVLLADPGVRSIPEDPRLAF